MLWILFLKYISIFSPFLRLISIWDSSLLEIFLSYSFQQVKGFFFMTNLSTFSLIFRIFVTLSPLYIVHSFSNF